MAHGKIFLRRDMPCGGSNDGRVVYITILFTADRLRDLRNGGGAGADPPEKQGQYVNET